MRERLKLKYVGNELTFTHDAKYTNMTQMLIRYCKRNERDTQIFTYSVLPHTTKETG